MMKLFCEVNEQLKAVDYSPKKGSITDVVSKDCKTFSWNKSFKPVNGNILTLQSPYTCVQGTGDQIRYLETFSL